MNIKEILKKIIEFIGNFSPFLYRPPYKIHGEKFEIHQNYQDIWPSYPHIHFKENEFKLDIYQGELYDSKNKKYKGPVSDKDMKKIWNDKKILEIIIKARKNKPINVGKLPDLPDEWITAENKEWIKEYEKTL